MGSHFKKLNSLELCVLEYLCVHLCGCEWVGKIRERERERERGGENLFESESQTYVSSSIKIVPTGAFPINLAARFTEGPITAHSQR